MSKKYEAPRLDLPWTEVNPGGVVKEPGNSVTYITGTWRSMYPMTPDGNPILGRVEGIEGFILATGACGQGFMLGPGVGQLLTHLIMGNLSEKEKQCLDIVRLDREWTSMEKLK